MAEAKRLHSLANRMELFAAEIAGTNTSPPIGRVAGGITTTLPLSGMGEYSGMTQTDAILKVLASGPKTTREMFATLNAGGQSFKKVSYITAVLGRLKDRVTRLPDGRVQLIPQ
jgi:hypothetical protein